MPRLRKHSAVLSIAFVVVLTGACSSDDGSSGDASSIAAATTSVQADVPAGSVRLGGAVQSPTTLSAEQLRAYPVRTQAVTFDSSKGSQSHTYDGASLADILTGAVLQADADAKNPELTLAVLATGSDGYEAVVSWGEISPDFAGTPVLVAYTEDGQTLDAPRLVVPGDVKGGRYVSDLTDLQVVDVRSS